MVGGPKIINHKKTALMHLFIYNISVGVGVIITDFFFSFETKH